MPRIILLSFSLLLSLSSLAQRKKIQKIEDSLTFIIKSSPKDIEGYSERASFYLWQRQFSKAQTDLRKILSIDPLNIEALTTIGFLYGETSKFDSAFYFLERCSKIDSSTAKATANQSLGYYLNEVGEAEKSLQRSDSALQYVENETSKGSIYNNKGFSYFKLGKIHLAKHYYQLSEDLHPDNPYLLKNKGLLKLSEGARIEACHCFHVARFLVQNQLIGREINKLIEENCKNQ